jgi:hypothetical protein
VKTPRSMFRLSASRVAKLIKRGGDGGGLTLQVSESGNKAWLFHFERDGRERQMGLGSLHTLTLAEAPQLALARPSAPPGARSILGRAAAATYSTSAAGSWTHGWRIAASPQGPTNPTCCWGGADEPRL